MCVEPNPFRLGRWTHAVDGCGKHVTDADRLHRQRHFAGDDSRNVENVLDEPDLRFGIALDHCDRMGRARVELTHPQNSRPSKDSIERRPQLVGQCAEKFIFQPIGVLRLAV